MRSAEPNLRTTPVVPRLEALFHPEVVAVVGATDREGSVGRAITENLVADFAGDVVAVNPGRDEVLGLHAADSVADTAADVAVVVVPAPFVVEVLRDCGESGIQNVVVVTAGFSESGPEGAARERDLRQVATEYDLNVVGPNCLGIISTPTGLNATFGPENATPGSLSFMSQSGAFVTAVLDWAADQAIGFRDVVSLGNKAVLDETDFLRYWGGDEGTDVVVGYLEDVSDGRAFIDAAREVTQDTPVVLVKSGRTEAGAQAASSHTGAIAGSEAAYEAGFDQAGVVRAETVEELFDAAQVLAGQPVPDGDRVAIVTNAGGPGVMATDAVGDSSLSMARFTDETRAALESALPDTASVTNPVDVIGDADLARFRASLDTALGADEVDCAVVLSAPTAVLDYGDLAEMVVEVQADHGTPVAVCLMGGDRAKAPSRTLADAGIPCFFDPARAVGSLDTLAEYGRISDRTYDPPTTFDDVDRDRALEILQQVRDRGDNRLGVEATPLLDAYGIPTPTGGIAESVAEAESLADEVGGDVVMKIVSPDILHKSDIGGVRVGVAREDVADTYEDLLTRARNYQPDATILGVQVQELLDTDAGVETIVGMNRDPQFGPLLLFGLGGIFVEVLEDTSVRVAPVSAAEAREMTEEIRTAPLLRGARGRDPVDREAIVEVVCRLSQLVSDFPAILELDVNPLLARPVEPPEGGESAGDDYQSVVAVDLRLTVDPEELPGRTTDLDSEPSTVPTDEPPADTDDTTGGPQ
jgi:acetyl coenzyme A synthetase (ADP forming)-like protein